MGDGGAAPGLTLAKEDGEGAERRAEDQPGSGGPDGDVGFPITREQLLMARSVVGGVNPGAPPWALEFTERRGPSGPAVRSKAEAAKIFSAGRGHLSWRVIPNETRR